MTLAVAVAEPLVGVLIAIISAFGGYITVKVKSKTDIAKAKTAAQLTKETVEEKAAADLYGFYQAHVDSMRKQIREERDDFEKRLLSERNMFEREINRLQTEMAEERELCERRIDQLESKIAALSNITYDIKRNTES